MTKKSKPGVRVIEAKILLTVKTNDEAKVVEITNDARDALMLVGDSLSLSDRHALTGAAVSVFEES